jgi:WD40 repeat protein
MQQGEAAAGEDAMFVLRGHDGAVRSLAYSPDGLRLASGGDDGMLRIWDMATLTEQSSVKSHSSIETLIFSPDGKNITIGQANGEMLIRHAKRWSHPSSIPCHAGGVRCLVHDGNAQLYSGGWDGKVKVWNIANLNNPSTFLNVDRPVTSLALTTDGKRLAVGCYDKTVKVHEPPKKTEIVAFESVAPLCLSFSPQGELLAMPDADYVIALVDSVKNTTRKLTGHTWTIYGLVFTPDGRTLISAGADGTVRIWDVETGSERATYRWHSSWVTCLAVSPDGCTAAAGSADHSIVVWDLEDDS